MMTPEQLADRESVWQRMAKEHPEFTRAMDISENYHTVREIVLSGSLTWAGANERFKPFPGAKVMDVGANVGIYSAFCAANGALVTAYEPHPAACEQLRRMVAEAGLRGRVQIKEIVISDHWGFCPFVSHINPDEMCVWYNGAINPKDGQDVQCIPFAEAIGEGTWDMVKLDVEGEEFDIILGTPDFVLRRIKFMYVEFHPWATQDLYDRTIAKLNDVFTFTGTFPNALGRWEAGYCVTA